MKSNVVFKIFALAIWTLATSYEPAKLEKFQDHYKAAKPKSPAENLRDPVNSAEQAHQYEEAVPEPQNLQKACFSYVVKICPIFLCGTVM